MQGYDRLYRGLHRVDSTPQGTGRNQILYTELIAGYPELNSLVLNPPLVFSERPYYVHA